jgi:methylamine dehydrogenase heavy chain
VAQALSQRGALNVSADGKFLLVQNATPATSITVADAVEGKDLGEIPTPGCWTAYPTLEGTAFTTLCGDGTLAKYVYDASGKAGAPAKSEQIFDADKDPLYGDAMRIDGKLVYVSYGGTLYVVDDSGETPVLDRTVPFAEADWAPGGYNLMAYNEPTHTLFVLMHSGPYDGSHKNPAEEIWAIDTTSMTVVGRSEAHHELNIAVSNDEKPVLVGFDHMGAVHRYDVATGDKVSLTETAVREGVASFPTMVVTDF